MKERQPAPVTDAAVAAVDSMAAMLEPHPCENGCKRAWPWQTLSHKCVVGCWVVMERKGSKMDNLELPI